MNPPLSYIDPSEVGGANVIAGITPVSMGGDTSRHGLHRLAPAGLRQAR